MYPEPVMLNTKESIIAYLVQRSIEMLQDNVRSSPVDLVKSIYKYYSNEFNTAKKSPFNTSQHTLQYENTPEIIRLYNHHTLLPNIDVGYLIYEL